MSEKNKSSQKKKSSEDPNSSLNNLPWTLPFAFPSLTPFGSTFPTFPFAPTNFGSLNSFASAFATPTPPPPTAPLLSTDPNNPTFDYNEYAKQFGLLLNAFAEQGASSSAETANGKTSTNPTGLPFPYFLPSLLNQPATQSNATNPFAALANPTAGLYPFLTPDWFTAGTTLPNATNEPHSEPKSAKKRSKSIRTLTEEQEKHHVSQATTVKADFPTKIDQNNNGARLTNLNETNDDTKSNDDDESDPNPKRKKTDEVNETLVRIPLNLGWKRVTIVRAITRTGVRGDVFYYAPCGRKLRSFQEIDRYLSKKNITTLDRSHFTFSSKVHIGHFHEPREGPDGKIVFHESTEDEIVNRILEINPKFRRIEFSSSPSITAEHDESRSTEMKSKVRPTPNSPYQHTDFLKAIIEQQEQERKRQEMHYMKQLEMKKREEEKLLLLEQRKAEKNALRAKKIKETYTDIVLANESRRIIEDLQLKDLKPLPMLKPVENLRLSNEAFANCLVVLEFLSKFKTILQIPESLIPTLQTLIHPTSSRDFNALCQQLLRVALEDPGIPNPKKALTNLGQKLSDVDITEHTFSEILRIYIRERNGFDDRLSQTLSDTSFPALTIDDKMEILAFLCNDLTTNKRVVEEIDRNLEEFIGLKHEKFELERRLRRLKFERSNSMALNNGNGPTKKMFHLREKDLNSSENESPDESDTESIVQDQAAAMADDQDIEMLDETKIEDFEKRLTLVTRKYLLLKRRLIEKQCQIRALQLGEDRYHRRYWFFPQLHSIYVEGLSSGEIAAEDLLNTVENLTKQKSDRKPSICPIQRKKPLKTPKQNENDDETTTNPVVGEDLATMDLSAFCMAVKREEEEATPTLSAPVDDNAPLDLSCAKSTNEKVVKDEEISAPIYFQNLLHHPLIASSPTPIDWTTINYKQIEESIREKFQSSQAASIPDEFQRGWWKINQIDELRSLIKSLAKRGERERGLCRTLQRYFDVISHSFTASTKSTELGATSPSSMENHESEMGIDEQQQNSFNEMNDVDASHSDRTHEMDVLNEIYHLADRIIASSLQCRSYDVHGQMKRFTSSEIQMKHIDILDEAKTFLADLERNIERRYLKPPFVRKSEINLNSLNRINQHGTYHHTQENSSNEIVSASKYDEVPQQLERWRRTVQECRTPAQLALCLTQLERCIAWEKSIMRVFCEICNSDVDEEKLLLCDGCDHGTHTYCFIPPMSFIPPNDWYCYVCIGKAKGENLCFVCGNKGDHPLHKCEHCSKHFHEECLKQGKQQRGKWLCVLCAANDPSTQPNNSTHNGKSSGGRQTSRSTGRPPSTPSNHRKSKSRPSSTHQTDPTILHETHSNSSHAETTNLSSVQDGSPVHHHLDFEDDPPSPSITGSTSNGKKKTNRKSKTNQNENEEIKACRMILNELIKQDTSWPFQTPVDPKQHPDYYDCIKHPMDFSTMKKKMRNHQYQNREEFHQDVELILNNCRYYNEDDSPVGEAGHALRQFFDARWAKQFG